MGRSTMLKLSGGIAIFGVVALAISTSAQSTITDPPNQRIWFGGDLYLGDGGQSQLSELPRIVGAGFGVVNLEGPIGVPPTAAGMKRRLVHATAVPAELSQASVRAATLENNHSDDLGLSGRRQTIRALRAAGMVAVSGLAEVLPVRLGRNSVAVLALDCTRGIPPQMDSRLTAARLRADLLVVSLHSTGAESYLPDSTLERAVELALRGGARVILGHGSHRLARVERRGNAVIAWGLGNLVFACDCTSEDEGLILRVGMGEGDSLVANVVPIRAGLGTRPVRVHEDVNAIADLLRGLGSTSLQANAGQIDF